MRDTFWWGSSCLQEGAEFGAGRASGGGFTCNMCRNPPAVERGEGIGGRDFDLDCELSGFGRVQQLAVGQKDVPTENRKTSLQKSQQHFFVTLR
jgi:hypothetical protein